MSELASEPSDPAPVRALWLPFEVEDLDEATRFYTGQLGLSVVDSWDRDGERGVVLRVADGAFVELVSPGTGRPPVLAFEVAGESEVDDCHDRWKSGGDSDVTPPYRHPRGHYGFTAPGPAGATIMVWSEK